MVLGGTASTSNRIKIIDFSTPWLETPIGFLIPYPTSNENIAAIVKPFDLTVITLINIILFYHFDLRALSFSDMATASCFIPGDDDNSLHPGSCRHQNEEEFENRQ